MLIDESVRSALRAVLLGNIEVEPTQQLALVERAIEHDLYRRKTSNEIRSVNTDTHEIDFVVTSDTVDRDQERVIPRAFEKHIKLYDENPVVLWSHRHDIPAVARMISRSFTDQTFEVKNKFAVDTTPLATELWKLYSADPPFMRAVSVGFIPLDWTLDPEHKLPDQAGRTFTEAELLEHSLVNVGSNRQALSKAYKSEQDTTLKKVLERLIEQPSAYEGCEHKAFYDAEGELLSECPICEAHNGLVVRICEALDNDEKLASLAPLFESELYDENAENLWIPQYAFDPLRAEDEKANAVSAELAEKPFENEDACRLREPGRFERGSFRRMRRRHQGKQYSVIMGRLKGQTSLTDQAFRYPISRWTESQARTHCRSHDGKMFEAATGRKSVDRQVLTKMPMPFTLVGTYERDQRDIAKMLRVFKPTLGIDRFDEVAIIGTTSTWVLCLVMDTGIFYLIDWSRDALGNIMFDNPRVIELMIQGGEVALQVNPDVVVTLENEEATTPASDVEEAQKMLANLAVMAQAAVEAANFEI